VATCIAPGTLPYGMPCEDGSQCASNICAYDPGYPNYPMVCTCIADNEPGCSLPQNCCSTLCGEGGTCYCLQYTEECGGNDECCSEKCNGGYCDTTLQCHGAGEGCQGSSQCCVGMLCGEDFKCEEAGCDVVGSRCASYGDCCGGLVCTDGGHVVGICVRPGSPFIQYCGDHICSEFESCSNCGVDCGTCAVQPPACAGDPCVAGCCDGAICYYGTCKSPVNGGLCIQDSDCLYGSCVGGQCSCNSVVGAVCGQSSDCCQQGGMACQSIAKYGMRCGYQV
jgi:hypothetical protein